MPSRVASSRDPVGAHPCGLPAPLFGEPAKHAPSSFQETEPEASSRSARAKMASCKQSQRGVRGDPGRERIEMVAIGRSTAAVHPFRLASCAALAWPPTSPPADGNKDPQLQSLAALGWPGAAGGAAGDTGPGAGTLGFFVCIVDGALFVLVLQPKRRLRWLRSFATFGPWPSARRRSLGRGAPETNARSQSFAAE